MFIYQPISATKSALLKINFSKIDLSSMANRQSPYETKHYQRNTNTHTHKNLFTSKTGSCGSVVILKKYSRPKCKFFNLKQQLIKNK